MKESPNALFPWPRGVRGAVSLTYDDGIENHLDIAIPQLDAAGLRGTFYLIPGEARSLERIDGWRDAFHRGHEIGNHTWSHPGRGVTHTRPLEQHDRASITEEVSRAACWLDAEVGPDPGRTFAYPYAQNGIGEPPASGDYEEAVMACHPGARLGGGAEPMNPWTLDPMRCRSWISGAGFAAETYIDRCLAALRTGGWTVLTFHGIGGPWIETAASEHRRLLEWLASQPLWVAPVRDILAWVLATRANGRQPDGAAPVTAGENRG